MTISARFFRWHRWLGWLVALQVLAWVAGGFVFTWVPFKPWVKAEDAVKKPEQPLPADWAAAVARHFAQQQQHHHHQSQPPHAGSAGPVLGVASVATARGPALKLRHAKGHSWVLADGSRFVAADEAAITRFALSLYQGGGTLADVRRLAEVPARLLIVREAGARRDVWRAQFDDALGTRLYFEGLSGELLAVRNDAWVLYDFFWRLHLMDYSEGEDFNHNLVRAASLAALLLVLTGLALSWLALRRAWRRRERAREHAGGGGA